MCTASQRNIFNFHIVCVMSKCQYVFGKYSKIFRILFWTPCPTSRRLLLDSSKVKILQETSDDGAPLLVCPSLHLAKTLPHGRESARAASNKWRSLLHESSISAKYSEGGTSYFELVVSINFLRQFLSRSSLFCKPMISLPLIGCSITRVRNTAHWITWFRITR